MYQLRPVYSRDGDRLKEAIRPRFGDLGSAVEAANAIRRRGDRVVVRTVTGSGVDGELVATSLIRIPPRMVRAP